MSIINLFIKELKEKLLMKTAGKQTEEIVLLKAFKYFDLSNTNLCDKQNFINALLKIGITGYTEEDISTIFDYYDTDNIHQINYKDFIGILYNNPSIMDNPEKLNEVNIKQQNYPYSSTPSEYEKDEKQNYQNFNQLHSETIQMNNNNNLFSRNSGSQKTIDDIIESIRNRIKKRGIRCIISLENNFRALDDDNSQTIDFDAFEKTAQDFRFGISYDELQKLFNFFNKERNGRIDYDEFIRIFRGQMSNSRRNLVEQIFNGFEQDQDGYAHINKINQLFNPKYHPDVLNGLKTKKEIYKEFIETFEGNHIYLNGDDAQYGNIDIDEFCDYYDSVSMTIEKDEEFENMVKGVWLGEFTNYNEQQKEKLKPLTSKKILMNGNNHNQNGYQEENNKIKNNMNNEEYEFENIIDEEKEKRKTNKGFESFKKYLQQKDTKTILSLARQFKIIDENGNKNIDFEGFCKGMKNSGLDIPKEILQELFNDFDYDNSGLISYDEFMDKLLGNLNSRREAVVRAAFKMLDLDKSGVIDLNELKSIYNTKNNPQVLNGEIDEEKLYSNFIETFGIHHNYYSGIRDKRVTLNEFLDYYKFISFNIPGDNLFEEILIAAWKLENTAEYIKYQRNEDIKRQRLLDQNLEEKSRVRKNESYTKGGGIPFGVDEPIDCSTSNMNNDNNRFRAERKSNNYIGQIKTRDNLNENINNEYNNIDTYNDEFNNDYNYKKPNQYQTENQEQYQKNASQTSGELALNILKDVFRERGSRGIFGMRRCFMIYDEENSNKLTFDNVYKYIKSFLIPLSRIQTLSLFKLYDSQNSGEIIYNYLVNDILGKLSESRKNIINNAFNKLYTEKKGVLNINTIKEGFNPNGHPDVINRKKRPQEILAEFLDNLDYHFNLLNLRRNSDDEEITNQEFIEFYRYISFGIEDDNYFNEIISGVWGLNINENNRKYY